MTHDQDVQALSSIVARHENDLHSPQMPLPGYTFTDIEHILWRYITLLEGDIHVGGYTPQHENVVFRGEESYLLEKAALTHHRLRLILHPSPTWQGIQLVLERESTLLMKVGFLSVAHHSVEEYFGCWVQQETSSSHQESTQILWRSLRHPIDSHSRLLWRGLRWLCANLLLWKRPQLFFPDDLDHPGTLLMP